MSKTKKCRHCVHGISGGIYIFCQHSAYQNLPRPHGGYAVSFNCYCKFFTREKYNKDKQRGITKYLREMRESYKKRNIPYSSTPVFINPLSIRTRWA